MQKADLNTVYDFGQSQPMAPSIKRADLLGWLGASLVAGLLAAFLAMAFVWREWPGLPAPGGAILIHISYWGKSLVHLLIRGVFSPEAREYAKYYAELGDAQRNGLIWRVAVGAWFACMPAVFLSKSYLTPRDSLIHLRGSRRFEGADATVELVRSLSTRVKRRPDHEIAPGVVYSSDMWTRHVLLVGGVGSGKSTVIKPLLDTIVKAGEQMLLFDPKSEFTMGFKQPILIAPWDKRTFAWDIATDMRNPLDMRRFAAAMIRESQDPMWSNASRQLLVGLMIYLKGTRGNDWGWRELCDLVALPQTSLLPIMRKWHPEAVRAVEKASVTTAGILINLSSFCSSIFDLAEAWGDAPLDRRISFVEWTHGKARHPQVILQGHGAYADLTKSYVEGIVGVVSAIINSVEIEDDPNRKIWFVADEFGMMGKIPVRPLFEVGRSRGVRCVVACQDLAQIEEIYGQQMVNALVAMCGTLVVGQMMQGETAEKLCKAFGTREVERANLSSSSGGGAAGKSSTLSFNRDEVALYKPSELSARLGLTQDGMGVKLVLFTGGTAYELFWPHYNVRRERPPHVPASWTTSLVSVAGAMGEGQSQLGAPASDGVASRGDGAHCGVGQGTLEGLVVGAGSVSGLAGTATRMTSGSGQGESHRASVDGTADGNDLGGGGGALVWDGELADEAGAQELEAEQNVGKRTGAKQGGARGLSERSKSNTRQGKGASANAVLKEYVVDRETGEIIGGTKGETGGLVQSRGDARLVVEAEADQISSPTHVPLDNADGSGERVEVRTTVDGAASSAECERESSALSDAMLESSLNAAGIFLAEPLLKAVHFAEALMPGLPGPKQEAFVAPRQIPKGQTAADATQRPAAQTTQHQPNRTAAPILAKAHANHAKKP